MSVYFIAPVGGGNIKIGHTENIGQRFRAISSWAPVPLEVVAACPGGKLLERSIHRRFATDRLYGEWFRPSADLLELISDIRTGNPPKQECECPREGLFWDFKADLRESGVKVKELAEYLGVKADTIKVNWRQRVPAHAAPLVIEFFRLRGITPKHIKGDISWFTEATP